jgi:hypothetical protein
MAVASVQANIKGQNYTLTFNAGTGKYEASVTAGSLTSYNENAGHYFPVQLTAIDDAGNSTIKDDTDTVLGASLKLGVREKIKPTIIGISPSSGAKLISANPTLTFQLRDEANGSGIKISTLVLKVDGGAAIGNAATGMTCIQVSNGYDCSYAIQTALSEGSHTVTIEIQDNDGNLSTAVSTTFTVDTVPPTLNITAPGDNTKTNNPSCTVSGTTNDATSSPVTVTIKLNGVDQGPVSVTSGSFSKALTLGTGLNTIVVRSTDSAGKYSEVTRTITLDTVPPTISAVTQHRNVQQCRRILWV